MVGSLLLLHRCPTTNFSKSLEANERDEDETHCQDSFEEGDAGCGRY